MPEIDAIRAEIERERKLVDRQRRDILTLQRAGRSTADAELILVQFVSRRSINPARALGSRA